MYKTRLTVVISYHIFASEKKRIIVKYKTVYKKVLFIVHDYQSAIPQLMAENIKRIIQG